MQVPSPSSGKTGKSPGEPLHGFSKTPASAARLLAEDPLLRSPRTTARSPQSAPLSARGLGGRLRGAVGRPVRGEAPDELPRPEDRPVREVAHPAAQRRAAFGSAPSSRSNTFKAAPPGRFDSSGRARREDSDAGCRSSASPAPTGRTDPSP